MAVPTITNTLDLHLDSTLGVTLTSGKVSLWADQAGSNDFSQSTAAKRPVVVTDPFHNRDAIYFDGVDDFLTSSYAEDGSDWTLFIAMRRESRQQDVVSEGGTEWASSATSSGSFFTGHVSTVGSAETTGEESVGRRGAAHDLKTDWHPNRWLIKEAGMNAAGTGKFFAINGEAHQTDVNPVTTPGNRQIGGNGSVPAFPARIYFGEILLFDGQLSADDRATILTYLSDRWVTDPIPDNTLSAVILATQPTAMEGYWQMDEPGGGILDSKELTSKDHRNTLWPPQNPEDLTYQNPGTAGPGINFAGTEFFNQSGRQYDVISGDFTIMGFMQALPLEQDRHCFWCEFNGSNFFGVGTSNAGVGGISQVAIALKVNNVFIYDSDHEDGTFANGDWVHICLRRSGSVNTLIINGTNIITTTAGSGSNVALTNLIIGAFDLNNVYTVSARWKGDIKHVALWNAALTDGEIETIYDTILIYEAQLTAQFNLGNGKSYQLAPFPVGRIVTATLEPSALTTPEALVWRDQNGNTVTLATGDRLSITDIVCANAATAKSVTFFQDDDGDDVLDDGEEIYAFEYAGQGTLSANFALPARLEKINAAATNVPMVVASATGNVSFTVNGFITRT